jgi:hypothetical protein
MICRCEHGPSGAHEGGCPESLWRLRNKETTRIARFVAFKARATSHRPVASLRRHPA